MKIEKLAARVGPGGLFRTGQIVAGQRSVADVYRQLARWVKSGKVVQLRRGVYVLNRPYAPEAPHPFAAANLLQRASYVSLQSALAHYGMIPEYTPVVTSVTTGRPENLETPIGRFRFRHIAKPLFSGFVEIEVAHGQFALVAEPEKALIDLLYLTPGSDDADYLAELRLEFPERFDFHRFEQLARSAAVPKAVRAACALREIAGEAER